MNTYCDWCDLGETVITVDNFDICIDCEANSLQDYLKG